MSDEIKNLDEKVDQLEEAAKKYASKDTVISIGGYEFTPAKLMVAFTIVSSTLGGLYGAFEVYKDYTSMKKRIAEYVAPDLSELNKKMEITMQNSEKSVQYTQDIKNDLKGDIRRLEGVVENVERSAKQSQREAEQAVKEVRADIRNVQRDTEQSVRILNKDIDHKIQKALDNPLAK